MTKRMWYEIEPKDAVDITLPHPDIQGPLTSWGEECPWPWDPIQLLGAPMGQYHCPFCGEMVMAGMDHLDYGPPKNSSNGDAVERWESEGGPPW